MRFIGWGIALLFSVVMLNLIWLATSTVRIHNASPDTITDVAYSACDTRHTIGWLASGESVFRLLQACGDDTLSIYIGNKEFCRTYVEGELYHVDAELLAGPTDESSVSAVAENSVDCKYDDLISSLFINKVLW